MRFFQFPSLALSFTLLARSVPEEHKEMAAGLYWAIGNVGVFVLSYLIDLVHRISGWHAAVDCVTALLVFVLRIVVFLRIPTRTITLAPIQ